jgi:hypothetical protein
VVFIETSLFTRLLANYLSDEEYAALQAHLVAHQTFMLTVYGKGEKEDLGSADLRKVARLLAEMTSE